ncbi:hypothetical protein TELCIR_12363, partial [Teladorsagia circumcincta]
MRQRYEGLHIFSIYSPQDDKVGYQNACGEVTSSIAGSDQEFKEFADRMLRIDIGLHGSFGGGDVRLVRPIRSFIQAVAAYTRKRVDVIGYSMGSPISRK